MCALGLVGHLVELLDLMGLESGLGHLVELLALVGPEFGRLWLVVLPPKTSTFTVLLEGLIHAEDWRIKVSSMRRIEGRYSHRSHFFSSLESEYFSSRGVF